jgi:hypothetical protein
VAEPSSWGVPAPDPDRLIKWFIGVVVLGVGINLLSGFVVAHKWVWLPSAAFVAALLIAVPSTGLLRRKRYRTTRARGMALLALTGYLAVVVWGSLTGWPLALMILSVAFLWEAAVMLMWSTLRSRADLDHVAIGTAGLLVGSAFLLLGVANPLDASTLGVVAGLLLRVAFMMLGAGALLLGVAFLLNRWIPVGISLLMFGVAAMSGGIAAFLHGWTLVAVALLLGPVTALLLGVAFLLDTAWVPVPGGRSRCNVGWYCGLTGRMDADGDRVSRVRGRVLAGWCRGAGGRLDIGGGPLPAALDRGDVGWYCGLAGRMDIGGGHFPAARDRGAAGRCRAPVPS